MAGIEGGRNKVMQVPGGPIHDWTFISRECESVLNRIICSDLDFGKITLAAV